MPAFDFITATALAAEKMSKNTPVMNAFPLASNVADGSLKASAVWLSFSTYCQNGGTWSPHFRPRSNDHAYAPWLNPIRLSLYPTIKLCGAVGLIAIASSAWRRNEQSWLTRMLRTSSRSKMFEHP